MGGRATLHTGSQQPYGTGTDPELDLGRRCCCPNQCLQRRRACAIGWTTPTVCLRHVPNHWIQPQPGEGQDSSSPQLSGAACIYPTTNLPADSQTWICLQACSRRHLSMATLPPSLQTFGSTAISRWQIDLGDQPPHWTGKCSISAGGKTGSDQQTYPS